jgi:hypothetical protein
MPRIPDPPDEHDEDDFEAPVPVGVGAGAPPARDAGIEDAVQAEGDTGPWGFPLPESDALEAGPPEAVERPRDELFVGVACAVLAATVFLPWYKSVFRNVSGWSSGTWGPIIFFLALAGVAIVALRRLKVPIAFPFDHSLILEGIGWLSVGMAFIKRFFAPHLNTFKYQINTWPMLATMFAAVAVALLGGRVSSGAPFVMRPGWFKDRAGKTGAALLGVALALGIAFGLTAGSSDASQATSNPLKSKQILGFPNCAKKAKFPQFAGFKATLGAETPASGSQQASCVVTFTAPFTTKVALARIETALQGAHWTFAVAKTAAPASFASLTLKAPKCGAVTIQQSVVPTAGSSKTKKPPAAKPNVFVQAYFYASCK